MHPAQNVVASAVLAEEIKLRSSTKKQTGRRCKMAGSLFEKEKPAND